MPEWVVLVRGFRHEEKYCKQFRIYGHYMGDAEGAKRAAEAVRAGGDYDLVWVVPTAEIQSASYGAAKERVMAALLGEGGDPHAG